VDRFFWRHRAYCIISSSRPRPKWLRHAEIKFPQERLDGLKELEIARTGLVRYIGTAVALAPDAGAQAQLADLADELHPNVRRQSLIAAADMS